ncbi:hypothetical protein C8R44DRAFT_895908 [Mycena epipterygia]|nr:hypothetical protein C8R44DRAFT_895908 [Mycena epipterygia]
MLTILSSDSPHANHFFSHSNPHDLDSPSSTDPHDASDKRTRAWRLFYGERGFNGGGHVQRRRHVSCSLSNILSSPGSDFMTPRTTLRLLNRHPTSMTRLTSAPECEDYLTESGASTAEDAYRYGFTIRRTILYHGLFLYTLVLIIYLLRANGIAPAPQRPEKRKAFASPEPALADCAGLGC